jgi:hypothetical protein
VVLSKPMMSQAQRIQLLIALLAVSIGIILFVDPVPQDLAYHNFADKRGWLGIPNFGDVASNAGFLVFGAIALVALIYRRKELFRTPADARPYLIYFIGVILVSLGSCYYHWAPSNASLLWDRLPMSIAFMAISAAVVADRINTPAGNGWVLAVLLVLGLASLFYWNWTESLGRGDLRFYGLVQFYPMLALPITIWAFPDHHYTIGRFIGWMIAWYGLSKVLEFFDWGIFELTGNLVSGHSLKHLAAAVATFMVLRMLIAANTQPAPAPHAGRTQTKTS